MKFRDGTPRVVAATLAAFTLALTLQLLAARQHVADPFHESPVSDALSYDRWARRIAARGLAAEPVFHQPPLFPALLSLAHAGAPAPGVARSRAAVGQACLAGLAVALLVPLGAVWFRSPAAGIAAAAIALLHAPFAFHALKLLPIPLALATQALALLALGLARRRPLPLGAPLAGATLGLAALARAEMLLFALPAAVALGCPPAAPAGDGRVVDAGRRSSRRRRTLAVLGFVAGLLVATLPAALHNLRQGDRVWIASAGGENLYAGNRRGAEGGHSSIDLQAGDVASQRIRAAEIAEEALGGPLLPSRVAAYWRGRAIEEIRADPLAWLRLEFKKLGRILHPGDPTDLYSLALERERYLPWLRVLPLPSWFVLGAGALGVGLALRSRARALWPLAAWSGVQALVLLVFFVSTRLRLPLLFALTPFGGYALAEGIAIWRRGSRRARAGVVAGGLGLAVLSAIGIGAESRIPPREVVRLASVLSRQERLDESLQVLAPILTAEPPYALGLDQTGWVLQKQGNWLAAAEQYRRALAAGMPPGREASTRTRLAMVLERTGDLGEAEREHARAVSASGADAGTWYERGAFLLRRGRRREARADLERAAALDPRWEAPRRLLDAPAAR